MSGRGSISPIRPDGESAAVSIARKYVPNLVPLDDLIHWWKDYEKNGCSSPVLAAKCDRMIVPLEECRRDLGVKVRTLAQRVDESIRLHESHGWCRCTVCSDAEASSNDAQRELRRSMDDMGRYIQPLVTRWFLEDGNFSVVDWEMQGPDYDFDILIADEHGSEYDVEVWFGQNKRHHASRELVALYGGGKNDPHIDHGSVPDRLKDVASDQGGINMSSKPDLPKIMDKLGQLRDGHAGFLIACRQQAGPTEMTATDFPIVPPESIQANKCIIVLDFDGEMVFGKHGTGYLVHHPGFNQSSREVARKVIRSLGFKYDQSRYTQKKELAKWTGWD